MTRSRWQILPLLRALFAPLDPILLTVLAVLLAYGWVLMESAAPNRMDDQVIHYLIALATMWLVACLKPSRLLSLAPPLYLLGLVLLIGVALFGDVSKGARRWLALGGMRLQPSEIMKIALPLMLAWFFQQRERNLGLWHIVLAGALLLVPVGLILNQPDLGTAILVGAAGLFVIYFAGLPWKLILPVVMLGVLMLGSVVIFGDQLCQPEFDWHILREYQKQRVCTMLDPTRDPLGRGFHIIQSTIAIGSGGFAGKGWMLGTQTHLAFLPERSTDFIFAVLAEEFGLLGVLGLLLCYFLLISRGLVIVATAATHGERLLAGGITLIFFTYAFVNMGMVSGILPVVGVPLPFISYGGTALITLCIGVGMLMSIQHARRRTRGVH